MASNPKTISVTYTQLGKMIDHSLLYPTMTDAEILAGLEIAKKIQCSYSLRQILLDSNGQRGSSWI